MSNVHLDKAIEDVLSGNRIHPEESGYYSYDIYADYRDCLEESSIIEIVKNEHPRDAFYEFFEVHDITWSHEEYVEEMIGEALECDNFDMDEEVFSEYIREWVREKMCFNFPFDHYLNQEVYVNVSIGTNESSTDYTLNNLDEDVDSKNWDIDEESSLMWLTREQNYSKKQLKKAFLYQEFSDSKFIKSVYDEVANTTSDNNQVVFLVKMSLHDYLNLKEEPIDFKISSDITTGLVDLGCGAGSILDIKLEEEFYIPKELLKLEVDGAVGYSISEIFGLMSSAWKQVTTMKKVA